MIMLWRNNQDNLINVKQYQKDGIFAILRFSSQIGKLRHESE